MFRRPRIAMSAIVIGLLAAGCGSSSDGAASDSGVTPAADTGIAPAVDSGTLPVADSGTTPPPPEEPLLQSVLETMSLPTAVGEYAVDLDGSGAKNQFGALLLAVASFGMDLQPEIDRELDQGNLLVLMELLGSDLTTDSDVTIRAHLGEDTDGDAANNFSGSAVLKIAASSPSDATLTGAIAAGKLEAGPGTLLIPLPLGTKMVVVPLAKAVVKAQVSADGLTDGVLAGAMAKTDLDSKVLPGVVDLITEALADPNISQKNKDTMLQVLDADQNGKIEVSDLKSGLIGSALAPDVDTDGDGAPDALSLGVGFTTVKCSIEKWGAHALPAARWRFDRVARAGRSSVGRQPLDLPRGRRSARRRQARAEGGLATQRLAREGRVLRPQPTPGPQVGCRARWPGAEEVRDEGGARDRDLHRWAQGAQGQARPRARPAGLRRRHLARDRLRWPPLGDELQRDLVDVEQGHLDHHPWRRRAELGAPRRAARSAVAAARPLAMRRDRPGAAAGSASKAGRAAASAEERKATDQPEDQR